MKKKNVSPLEALEKIKFYAGDTWVNSIEWNIIESALKRLEKIENTTHSVLREDISNNLKALEIIKEKFRILEPIGFDVKKDSTAFGCIIQKKDLTQKEYDLLKEVLL